MRLCFVLVLLLVAQIASAERYASPIYSPFEQPPINPHCTLSVFVTEFPVKGKFYMHYKVSSLKKRVSLSIDERQDTVPPGEDFQSGLGQVFDPLNPLGVEKIVAKFDGFRHCAGSPFDVTEFVNRRAVERLYADVFYRNPENQEYFEGWSRIQPEERSRRVRKLLTSVERRRLEIESYVAQFIPGGQEHVDAELLSESNRSMQEVLSGILATPIYYQRAGASNEGYIAALYRDVLGLAPEAGEYQLMLSNLQQGIPRKQIALYLLGRPQFRKRLVRTWYQTYLDRSAKPEEITKAMERLSAGAPWEYVQSDIMSGEEYFQKSTLTETAALK